MQENNPQNNPDFDDNGQPSGSGFIRNLNPFAYVIVVLAIIFFLYQIIGGTIELASGAGTEKIDVKITRIILIFSQFMFILAPAVFFARLQSPDLKNTFRLHLPKIHLLIFAILGMILIQPALQGYMVVQDYVINYLPAIRDFIKPMKDLFDSLEKETVKIVSAYSDFEFIIVVIVVSVTPAICEEFLFRGFVLKNFEKISKPSIAIFLSGFLFGLYHFQPLNIVPLVMLGVFLGFVVYCSDSIYTGIVCHFLNNFFASYLLYKFGKEDFDTPRISSSEKIDAVILAGTSMILLASIMFLMYRLRSFRAEAEASA